MNATANPPPLPVPAPPAGLVAALLKDPARIAESIANRERPLGAAAQWLAVGLVCDAVFGIAVGLFGGWPVAAMDAAKMPLVGFCSLLLCFPSLYVFSCVAGMPLTLRRVITDGQSAFGVPWIIAFRGE